MNKRLRGVKAHHLLPLIGVFLIFSASVERAVADDDDAGPDKNATVFVKTMMPVEKTLPRQLLAYGTVLPDLRKSTHIVMPRAGQVTKLAVSQGEQVQRGQKLFEFTTGSATILAYQQAQSALSFARSDLARTRELFSERLATKAQVATSEKAVSDASLTLQALSKTGAAKPSEWIASPDNAVVTEVTASVGERIDLGGGVMQLTQRGAVRIHLGIEPEKLGEVHTGMVVTLKSVFGDAAPVNGRIDELHGVINPQTRLVDAIVGVDGNAALQFLPGMQVVGTITLSTVKSWVVPRQALLTDADGAYLFQVKGGKAVRVNVHRVLDTGDVYGVEGNLDPKAPLVTLGNYELSNGQATRATAVNAPASGAKSEPN